MSNFTRARCAGARFDGVDLTHADLSRADVTAADFSGATLARTRLHRVQDQDTVWPAGRVFARGADEDLVEAEEWQARVLRAEVRE